MIIHHDFEMSPKAFEQRKAWPTPGLSAGYWKGDYASQSPLNAFFVSKDGGGANGTAGYLAVPGANSDQFYAEASPLWERPSRTYDLRNTRASMYLKAITPIVVNDGFQPYVFIDDFEPQDDSLCGWYLHQPLRIGSEWTLNEVDLLNDESRWTRYSNSRPLDKVLSRVGFIGVMYLKGIEYKGVNARGILGIDEFRFNLPI